MLSDYDEPKEPTSSIPYDFWYGFRGVFEAIGAGLKGIVSFRYWDWECVGFFAALFAIIGALALSVSVLWYLVMGCLT